MGRQFSPAHITAAAVLANFRVARASMLANTPVAENPALFERTQECEDRLHANTMLHRGEIMDHRDSVDFDNAVLDEIEDRRQRRRRVRDHKRMWLASALADRH